MGRVIFWDSTKPISYVALDSLGEFWQDMKSTAMLIPIVSNNLKQK